MSDDSAALVKAFSSGRPVDGEGLTYGVVGSLRIGAMFKGASNCVLRQFAGSERGRVLSIENASGFNFSNVRLLRSNGDDNAFVESDVGEQGGFWFLRCSQFKMSRVVATGGGVGTSLTLSDCSVFSIEDPKVSSIRYHRHQRPRDDILHGIWLNRCRQFELVRPWVTDLGGVDDQGFSRDNNRAIAVSGCQAFRITDLTVSDCGQGLDVTGSDGNHDFQIVRGHAANCWTWGFKFANSAQHVRVSGAIAEACGLGGFVVSGRSELSDPPPEDIEFLECQALDCGRLDIPQSTFGFGVLHARPDSVYPQNVRFVRCAAVDRRPKKGMKWGFLNEINAPPPGANVVMNCTVRGASVSEFRGFGATAS